MIDLKKYGKVNYQDFRKIIWKAGYSIADLNRYINRSQGYMDKSGHDASGIVKTKHVIDLCGMIGEEMFMYCFEEVMKANEEENKRRERRMKAREYMKR